MTFWFSEQPENWVVEGICGNLSQAVHSPSEVCTKFAEAFFKYVSSLVSIDFIAKVFQDTSEPSSAHVLSTWLKLFLLLFLRSVSHHLVFLFRLGIHTGHESSKEALHSLATRPSASPIFYDDPNLPKVTDLELDEIASLGLTSESVFFEESFRSYHINKILYIL